MVRRSADNQKKYLPNYQPAPPVHESCDRGWVGRMDKENGTQRLAVYSWANKYYSTNDGACKKLVQFLEITL
jgi:hypothetical protein